MHTAVMHGKLPTYLALSSSTAIDLAEIVKFGYKVLPDVNYKDFTLTLGHAKFNIAQYRRSRFVFYLPSNYGGVKKSWTIMHYFLSYCKDISYYPWPGRNPYAQITPRVTAQKPKKKLSLNPVSGTSIYSN